MGGLIEIAGLEVSAVDALLYAWFALSALSTVYVAWDNFVNKNPEETAQLFVTGEQVKNTLEDILAQMKAEGVRFSTTPNGLMKYAEFMKRTGTIEKAPASWKDLVFDNLQNEAGS